ncbi:hypothetical protein Q5752_002820 [Cryptotrichosporon argae]
MAPRFTPPKFRNATASLVPREEWYRTHLDAPTMSAGAATSFSSGVKTTRAHVVVVDASGGISVRAYGSASDVVWAGRVGPVGDWDASALEGGGVVLGGTDGTLTVLDLDALPAAPVHTTHKLDASAQLVVLHPTTPGLAFIATSASWGIYDLTSTSPASVLVPALSLEGDTRGIWSASWSPDGSRLSTISRSGVLSTYSPRISPAPTATRSLPPVLPLKPCRLTYVADALVLTAFSRARSREYHVLSPDLATRASSTLDAAQAPLGIVPDHARRIAYLAGRGDMTIRQIEVGPSALASGAGPGVGAGETAHALPFPLGEGLALEWPGRLDVMRAQIARLVLPLADKDGAALAVLSVQVPRRQLIDFHEDLFPDVRATIPEQTPAQWLAGHDAAPRLVSLDPARRGAWEAELEKYDAARKAGARKASAGQQSDTAAHLPTATPAVQPERSDDRAADTHTASAPEPAPDVRPAPAETQLAEVSLAESPTVSPAESPAAGGKPPAEPPAPASVDTSSTPYKLSLIVPFVLARLAAHDTARGPLFLGLQGPQGSGKTTVCRALVGALADRGVRAAVLSQDDLYRTHAGLRAVAAKHPDNALLAGRGPPGTHDVDLARRVLGQLERVNAGGSTVHLPVFDKSQHNGEGDRSASTVPVTAPVDVVVLEGWSFGFRPLGPAALAAAHADPSTAAARAHSSQSLAELNAYLAEFADLYTSFDALVSLQPDDYAHVYAWRAQAEHEMRANNGGRGMTDDQVAAFVDRYMPVYEVWGRTVDSWRNRLVLRIGGERQVLSSEVVLSGSDGHAVGNGPNASGTDSADATEATDEADGETARTTAQPATALTAESRPMPAAATAVAVPGTTTSTQLPAAVPATAPAPSAPAAPTARFNPTWSRKFLAASSPLIPSYDQLPALSSLHPDSQLLKMSPTHLFFPIAGPGGRVMYHARAARGRLDTAEPAFVSAGVEIAAFDVDEHGRLAVAGEDGVVRVWTIADSHPGQPVVIAAKGVEKIVDVAWHATVNDLLVVASNDAGKGVLRFFHAKGGDEVKRVEFDVSGIHTFAVSPNGERIAVASKDRAVLVVDPRTGGVARGPAHDSPRSFQLAWVGDAHVVSLGFARGSQRRIQLYSVPADLASEAEVQVVAAQTIDTSPSVLFPVYDPDTAILYVWGKGERDVSAYEVHAPPPGQGHGEPTIAKLPAYTAARPQLGLCFAPKTECNVRKVEVARALRLTAKTVEEVTFAVPRHRIEYFQDDVYPLTRGRKVVSIDAWRAGKPVEREWVDLRPDGMAPLSEAPKTAVAKPKFVSAQTVLSEAEKKRQEMDALFEKAKADESSDEDEPTVKGLPPPDDDW